MTSPRRRPPALPDCDLIYGSYEYGNFDLYQRRRGGPPCEHGDGCSTCGTYGPCLHCDMPTRRKTVSGVPLCYECRRLVPAEQQTFFPPTIPPGGAGTDTSRRTP